MVEGKIRVTLKDIATQAGVSVTTVHLALHGKPGPKEATREQIVKIADQLHYQSNAATRVLRSGVARIAALLPSLINENLYYYPPIWQGIQHYCREARDFHLELVEVPYVNHGTSVVPVEAIKRAMREEKLSGLIVLGDIEQEAKRGLKILSEQGIPTVLINGDVTDVERLCCIQANNYLLGRAMGEMVFRQTRRGSSVLVCAGDPNSSANYDTAKGIEDYLNQHEPRRVFYRIYYSNDMEALYKQLKENLKNHKDIGSCCSVTARGSVQLARALTDMKMAGMIPAIGSDVFPQNIESLKRGVLTNLIYKNPARQGWLAADKLFHFLIRNKRPNEDVCFVRGEVVFESTLPLYENFRLDMNPPDIRTG